MWRQWFLHRFVWLFFRLWTWTWRIEVLENTATQDKGPQDPPLIFAHWHGDELAIVPLVTRFKISTMTSTSKDGQIIDFVIRRLGGATSKGSSTRGGVGALKGLVKLCRSGFNASMAVDGPRGPIYRAKPGIFELSRLTRGTIIPLGAAASSAFIFTKSWNKAQLPKPFAKIVVKFGEPFKWEAKTTSTKDPALAQSLAVSIHQARDLAQEHLRSR